MRLLILPAALLAGGALLAADGSAPAAAETTPSLATGYDIDATHSGVLFRIQHLGVSYFHGRFNSVSGEYVLDREEPGASSVRVSIDTASVDTNSEGRDRHIKSPDFLNAKQFPKAAFVSTSIAKKADDVFTVTGDLELHGEKKEVVCEMTLVGEADTAMGARSGFEGMMTIRRSEFGMKGMLENLGDEVTLKFFIEGTQKK